jgi:hypothetical protein
VTRTFHPAGIPALCAAVVAGQYPATIKLTRYPPTTLLPQTSRNAFKRQLVNLGLNPIDELQAFVKAEAARWGKVVQEVGIAGSE